MTDEQLNERNDTYYGFNTNLLNNKFEGGLTYCNTFCVNNEYQPVAVYKVGNPNRSKSHKDYLLVQLDFELLTLSTKSIIVRGMNKDELLKWQFQDGIKCLKCEDVIYSVMRHSCRSCQCGECSIDGGPAYTRILGDNNNYELVTIDLIKNEIVAKQLG